MSGSENDRYERVMCAHIGQKWPGDAGEPPAPDAASPHASARSRCVLVSSACSPQENPAPGPPSPIGSVMNTGRRPGAQPPRGFRACRMALRRLPMRKLREVVRLKRRRGRFDGGPVPRYTCTRCMTPRSAMLARRGEGAHRAVRVALALPRGRPPDHRLDRGRRPSHSRGAGWPPARGLPVGTKAAHGYDGGWPASRPAACAPSSNASSSGS